jgi:pentatricopeptide repeat protein
VNYSKSISESKYLNEFEDEEEEESKNKEYEKVLNHIRLSNVDRQNSEEYYGNKMKKLAKSGNIKEAIDVFYKDMMETDRFKPTVWLYKTLMIILAREGYTHMVFALFKKVTLLKKIVFLRFFT